MALNDMNIMETVECDDDVNVRREYNTAVKIEEQELILYIVGSFGHNGAVLSDIES